MSTPSDGVVVAFFKNSEIIFMPLSREEKTTKTCDKID
jgi:hypothetical protein